MSNAKVKDSHYWATYPLEVMARGHVLNDEEVRLMCAALSDEIARRENERAISDRLADLWEGATARIEAMKAEHLAAQELVEIVANPVRSDDGYYDYFQADIDAALNAYRKATGGNDEQA